MTQKGYKKTQIKHLYVSLNSFPCSLVFSKRVDIVLRTFKTSNKVKYRQVLPISVVRYTNQFSA